MQTAGTPAQLEACRYADTQFPEPGEFVPQQIHVMPASKGLAPILWPSSSSLMR